MVFICIIHIYKEWRNAILWILNQVYLLKCYINFHEDCLPSCKWLFISAKWHCLSEQTGMCQVFSINRHNYKHNGALSCHGDEELHPHFSLTWAGHLQFNTTKSQLLLDWKQIVKPEILASARKKRTEYRKQIWDFEK
jgi:hypothetical protein